MSTLMDIDSPAPLSGLNGANGLGRAGGMPQTVRVQDVINTFRPTKSFTRHEGGSPTSILSLDFDDPGELMMTSESDESIQIYSVKDGKHSKQCLSKKYGVKHAKFSRTSTCVIYASTKGNDTIRYLSTHDNSFLRYFKGHEKPVTCIAVNPGADTFISCGEDDTVQIWDVNTEHVCGKLFLSSPYLAAWDPSANVIAVASEAAQTILLYDYRNYDKEPFATFDMLQYSNELSPNSIAKNWNKLEFSNDGKHLLVGTSGQGHFLIDAFDGKLKSYLVREKGGPKRLAAGEHNPEGSEGGEKRCETSGDTCFTPDGRYVISGQRGGNVLVWDTLTQSTDKKNKPMKVLAQKSEAAVTAFNPRYNFFATADREVIFWTPDPNA